MCVCVRVRMRVRVRVRVRVCVTFCLSELNNTVYRLSDNDISSPEASQALGESISHMAALLELE